MNVRLGEADRQRLDRLAAECGATRTEVVRRLLAEADDAPRPGVPDRAELVMLLAERAREGSVRAIELLLMRRWASGPPGDTASLTKGEDDPFAEVDQLRRRREQRRA